MSSLARGHAAEHQVRLYLEKQRFTLVEKNFRTKTGEIDLIMSQDSLLVFVEVRLRRHGDYGSGAASVTKRKQQMIINTARLYLQSRANSRW